MSKQNGDFIVLIVFIRFEQKNKVKSHKIVCEIYVRFL